MSLFRRLFNGLYRRARAAEGAGDYRRAATLYAEADLPEEAANALLFHAARAATVDERVGALKDALRWLSPEHARRHEVEAQIGLAVLDRAQKAGVAGAESRRRLEEAAGYLEAAGRPGDAATAYELLGSSEDVVRCLQSAGDVERLEVFLEHTGEEEKASRQVRGFISDYRIAMRYGARADAYQALRKAIRVAPDEGEIADWIRDLDGRRPQPNRVELRVDGRRCVYVALDRAVIGRAGAPVSIRGLAMSRRHGELTVLPSGALQLRDLGSKNGTYVSGFAVQDALDISTPTDVSFGDDVLVRIGPMPGGGRLEVLKGIDQGTLFVVGAGSPRAKELAGFTVDFEDGWAGIRVDSPGQLRLDGEVCALPVFVLAGDRIEISSPAGTVRIEVIE